MATPAPVLPVSVDDYLAGELTSKVRHEYVDGEVYAMVGASTEHNLITGNVFAVLHAHMRGTPCRVFMSDMKVRVQFGQIERFYYPDVQVCCDPADRERYFRTRPRLIVEVLSTHTEREDRSRKFHAYKRLDSLQEYILIAQDCRRVEVYRRQNHWNRSEIHENDQDVKLESLDLTLPIAVIYEGVELEQTRPAGETDSQHPPFTK